MIKQALLIFGFLIITPVTLAATDNFTVSMRVVNDIVPPTIPGSLTIASTTFEQVDLTWTASTDDTELSGYQIFRDGSAIATTTNTTYTDESVLPETLYTYAVRAFDLVYNYSTTSDSVSTTTLAVPPPPPTPTSTPLTSNTSGATAVADPQLTRFAVTPSFTSARMEWKTEPRARYELRWGQTESYELGLLTTNIYQGSHETVLGDLEPNTMYEYELIAYGRYGQVVVVARDQFMTLALPDTTLPANISNFRAAADGADVVLTWQNPETDFARVRIVRNPRFYPTDPNNGFVVYDGPGSRFRDVGILNSFDGVYYTAFTYDEAGNRSSGALASVVRSSGVGGVGETGIVTEAEAAADDNPIGTTTPPWELRLDGVVILQDGEVIEPLDGTFLVDVTRPFTFQAPYELFPRHLKAISLTLMHPVDDDVSYSYLLRSNANQTAYEAYISAVPFTGTIPFTLAVHDYTAQRVATATGSIIAQAVSPEIAIINNILPWYWDVWWLLLLLLLLVLWWRFGLSKR